MKSFNVIIYNFNGGEFIPYDIMPYLLREYDRLKVKPSTMDDLKTFIDMEGRSEWWCRCEWEIILVDWPNQRKADKWDVYQQIKMNLDLITEVLAFNISNRE